MRVYIKKIRSAKKKRKKKQKRRRRGTLLAAIELHPQRAKLNT